MTRTGSPSRESAAAPSAPYMRPPADWRERDSGTGPLTTSSVMRRPTATRTPRCPRILLYYINVVAKEYNGDTVRGVAASEELIEQAVNCAEADYDVETLKRRGRPKLNPTAAGESAIIPVRMDEELLGALTAKAEQHGLTRSEAIREAIRLWAHVA